MTPRQKELLQYHQDVAVFATSEKVPVFVILDLDDREGFAIASEFEPACAEKRDAIKDSGSIPAFTLAMPIAGANALLADGWPYAKPIPPVPSDMVAIILISDGRCLALLIKKG